MVATIADNYNLLKQPSVEVAMPILVHLLAFIPALCVWGTLIKACNW